MSNLRNDITQRFVDYIKNNTKYKNHTTPISTSNKKREPNRVVFYKGIELKCKSTMEYSLRIIIDGKLYVYYRKDKPIEVVSEEEFFQLSLIQDMHIVYKNIADIIDMYLNNGYNYGFGLVINIHTMEEDEFLF